MSKAKAVISIIGAVSFLLAAALPGLSQEDREIGKEYVTSSGLKYTIVQLGNGPKAEEGKEIGLHGIGSFPDGKIFWNSRDPVSPFYFVLGVDRVIKGCSEGVALMRVGDRFIFTLPPELGYGEKGSGTTIPPNATLIFDYEILSVETPKTPIAATLFQIINEKGISQAVSTYLWLKKDKSAEYNFREDQLNTLGYKLLADGKIKEAVAILELNASAYPESYNAYDSLGEAYLADGQKDKAIANYEKSLLLNPKNENAAEMLKKLKG
jgi:tetratricopeptide (TPR) repeat protein